MTAHMTDLMNAIGYLVSTVRSDAVGDIEVEIPPPFSMITLQNFRRTVALWNESGRRFIRQAPARSCPACGSSEADFLFETFDGYPTVECVDCGTWYIPRTVDYRLFEQFFERSPQARALAREMIEARLQSTGENDVA